MKFPRWLRPRGKGRKKRERGGVSAVARERGGREEVGGVGGGRRRPGGWPEMGGAVGHGRGKKREGVGREKRLREINFCD